MMIPEQIAITSIFYFEQVFVFSRLISKSVMEWFLLIMCKEHTLTRSANLISRNYPTLCFCVNGLVDSFPYKHVVFMINYLIELPMGKLILNHFIGNNCPEFPDGLLDSYFSKLTLGSDCLKLCFWTVTFKTILTQ